MAYTRDMDCDRKRLMVTRMDNHEANAKQQAHHYLQRKIYVGHNVSYKVAYKGLDGWGVLMYGYPVFHRKKHLLGPEEPLRNGELVELCRVWLPDQFPKNSESCAIGKSIKLLRRDWRQRHFEQPLTTKRERQKDGPVKVIKEIRRFYPYPRAIISFADGEFFHGGGIYEAANFTYLGKTKGRKATPGKGQGRWAAAKEGGHGQEAGQGKSVYLILLDQSVYLEWEKLKATYA